MRRHNEIERRLSGLEATKKAEDDGPIFHLNFAGRDCPRVRANGVLLERGPDETPEAFQERIEASRNGAKFFIVNSALTEEEWEAEAKVQQAALLASDVERARQREIERAN